MIDIGHAHQMILLIVLSPPLRRRRQTNTQYLIISWSKRWTSEGNNHVSNTPSRQRELAVFIPIYICIENASRCIGF